MLLHLYKIYVIYLYLDHSTQENQFIQLHQCLSKLFIHHISYDIYDTIYHMPYIVSYIIYYASYAIYHKLYHIPYTLRDALQHLSYVAIASSIATYCRNDASYLLVGSYLESLDPNNDIAVGGCFNINLLK